MNAYINALFKAIMVYMYVFAKTDHDFNSKCIIRSSSSSLQNFSANLKLVQHFAIFTWINRYVRPNFPKILSGHTTPDFQGPASGSDCERITIIKKKKIFSSSSSWSTSLVPKFLTPSNCRRFTELAEINCRQILEVSVLQSFKQSQGFSLGKPDRWHWQDINVCINIELYWAWSYRWLPNLNPIRVVLKMRVIDKISTEKRYQIFSLRERTAILLLFYPRRTD